MRSLRVLKAAKEICDYIPTKSGIMLGIGETEEEILGVMRDMREHQIDIMTMGQHIYVRLATNCPCSNTTHPKNSIASATCALSMGFKTVHSGPLVRSSVPCRRNRPSRPLVFGDCFVSQEEASSSNLHALVAAQKLLDDGKLEECLTAVKTYWLKYPEDPQAVMLFARLMNDAGRSDLAGKLERLSNALSGESSATSLSDLTSDLFESGRRL